MSDAAEEELSDEELAAQWAAEGEIDEENKEPERILSQDEIDNLLGSAGVGAKESGGINFLINNSKLSHERLPMLEVVFDRLVRNLTTSLRNFTSSTVDLSVDEMTSVRFGDYLDTVSLPALLTVFKAEEWETLSLLYVETGLVYTLVDTLLGGKNETAELKVEGRPFTSIERGLVKELADIILIDFTQAFSSIAPVTFSYDRMETTPRFAAIVRPVDAAILVNVRITMEGRGGNVQFCIPYASIEPVRDQIVQMFMGEKSGGDSMWSGHLQSEVWDAEVEVDTILGEMSIPLGEALKWKVGSQIVLRTKPQSLLKASVGGFKILEGKAGRRDGFVSLRVEQNMIQKKLQRIYEDQQNHKKETS
ncbi:MAG: flagellar motor switch protein FliM [Alphaproteobacteria bacterium]|nr:flagellar motor switch protein FliM [Alphaproteobacteria bacterium]NCQ67202.1 flagellar motor switch protein FliM [Alphaproteobacteria bacterium]NCT07046.1 flagellar motor switch protein FliM [Alphaproteobacteria bacterium]